MIRQHAKFLFGGIILFTGIAALMHQVGFLATDPPDGSTGNVIAMVSFTFNGLCCSYGLWLMFTAALKMLEATLYDTTEDPQL